MLLSRRKFISRILMFHLALLSGHATNAQNLAGLDLVRVPADEGAPTTFRVTWFSGVDALASASAYVNADANAIHGTLVLTDRSLTFLVGGTAASRSGTGLHIRYIRIASVEVRRKMKNRVVVIRRRDGKVDSFQIRRTGFIDREQTEAAGQLLQSKLQMVPVPVP